MPVNLHSWKIYKWDAIANLSYVKRTWKICHWDKWGYAFLVLHSNSNFVHKWEMPL